MLSTGTGQDAKRQILTFRYVGNILDHFQPLLNKVIDTPNIFRVREHPPLDLKTSRRACVPNNTTHRTNLSKIGWASESNSPPQLAASLIAYLLIVRLNFRLVGNLQHCHIFSSPTPFFDEIKQAVTYFFDIQTRLFNLIFGPHCFIHITIAGQLNRQTGHEKGQIG